MSTVRWMPQPMKKRNERAIGARPCGGPVVIGARLAEHAAAMKASRAGERVMLVERGPKIGGGSLLSGGCFAFAGTAMHS